MSKGWSKGFTKETNVSVRKISETMKSRNLDNSRPWRDEMRSIGLLPSYAPLERNADLAELIGAVLGDGNIGVFPRSEVLRIASNSNNPGFAKRYAGIIFRVFGKRPTVAKVKRSNCLIITIYEQYISKRLNIPSRNKKGVYFCLPRWISSNKVYLAAYLRGLIETDGSHCIHLPTGTYKLFFSNRNNSLLNNVQRGLKMLGFHPHRSTFSVQLSKKKEVFRAIEIIKFRDYKKNKLAPKRKVLVIDKNIGRSSNR
ncbi:MAG: hypothetical protein HZA95_01540 [Candidatus Vogelbacteria bacterium]|nr:hypothetical protein [Candidatus Vogelbacteria bacterium]